MDTTYYIAAYLGIAVAHVLLLVLMSRRGVLGDTEEVDKENPVQRGNVIILASLCWMGLWPLFALLSLYYFLEHYELHNRLGIRKLEIVPKWLGNLSKPYTPESTLRKLQKDYSQ